MKYTLLKTQRTSGWHLKYGSWKLPLYPQRYEDVQGSGCEAVGITDFGKRWRWIARLQPSVGSLHLPVGLQIGWVPWANLTSFYSWHLTLVVESLYKSGTDSCVCLLTTVTERAVPAYWQRWQNELCLLTDNGDRTSCVCLLTTVTERAVFAYWQRLQNELCLLTDNGGRTSCACLPTIVAEWAVSAYWQRWQNELCLLTDNGGRISPSVVSTSNSNVGQPEFEARPGRYSTSVQAISWVYSVSFGKTRDSTLLQRPVQLTEILSGRYIKIGICILKPSTSVWFQGGHTDFQTLHHPVL